MPLYDYRCGKCGAIVEMLAPADGRKALRHDVDGGKLWRQISAPTVVYKGDGWAKKDRRDGGKE